MIQIRVDKCVEVDGIQCKSDEDIKFYFAEQFLSVLSNQLRFDFEQYGEDSIIKESAL